MNGAARIRPFVGRLPSTASHVRDPDDFEADARVLTIRSALDLTIARRRRALLLPGARFGPP